MLIKGWGFAFALILSPSAQAADQGAVVLRATKLLEEISSNPESGIPPKFLKEAAGIAIVPHMIDTQIGIGRNKGHGVFLSRDEKGEWGNPVPFEISGVSVGLELGREITDMVMIYRTQKAADEYAEQILSLALSAQAHHSLERNRPFHGPGPDSKSKKKIFTYTRHWGIKVGATVTGEHTWGPSLTPAEMKVRMIDKMEDTPKVIKPSIFGNAAKATLTYNSPEVIRLKTVLAAMTAPPAQVAEMGKKDSNASRTSGAKPSTSLTASPRTSP